ncbi:unnamed protein product [Caenorhabditis auriculariae]|uniref:DUF7087 domain-containing protein n=1 Tax=Caenorhabditis auriculariae TaxID=2777116 RepID=A0A8S1HU26_9PELO|nr:unnamed protein product [Caenorhabditis auriculariae]
MENISKMVEKVVASYDFAGLINNTRLIQLICAILQIFLVYTESGSLSLFTFLTYSVIIGFLAVHLFRRWYYNIDGRYDVRQMLRESETSLRVQYAVALFAPLLLGLLTWWLVVLNNGLVHVLFFFSCFAQILAAVVQLFFEFYEVVYKSQ